MWVLVYCSCDRDPFRPSPLSTVPLLVKIVVEYCQCADELPMLVNELMSKLVETLQVRGGGAKGSIGVY